MNKLHLVFILVAFCLSFFAVLNAQRGPQRNAIYCGDRIRLQGYHDRRYLTASRRGCTYVHSDGTRAQGCANFERRKYSSLWTVVCDGHGTHRRRIRHGSVIGLRSVYRNYLVAEPAGCQGHGGHQGCLNANRPWFRQWERFTVESGTNSHAITDKSKIGLKSYHGLYVVHESDHSAHANRRWFRQWEQMTIEKA